jgi:hypothetical protein
MLFCSVTYQQAQYCTCDFTKIIRKGLDPLGKRQLLINTWAQKISNWVERISFNLSVICPLACDNHVVFYLSCEKRMFFNNNFFLKSFFNRIIRKACVSNMLK